MTEDEPQGVDVAPVDGDHLVIRRSRNGREHRWFATGEDNAKRWAHIQEVASGGRDRVEWFPLARVGGAR